MSLREFFAQSIFIAQSILIVVYKNSTDKFAGEIL